jgi:hypothetical protein
LPKFVSRSFAAPQTVVIVLDDPTALGGESSGRRLVLGLDGADRVKDARGQDVPPVLLASENRSVLAYAVAPTAGPVSVTVACEQGWSLVGVLASSDLGPDAAVALISARGLDAALSPFVPATSGSSRLVWRGTERPNQRRPRRRRASTERKAG